MFHKAIHLELKEGTSLELTFQSGEVKQYDMAVLFDKYPQLTALKDRNLFLRGKLLGSSGIIWNDELDIEAETIYEDGITVRRDFPPINVRMAYAVTMARKHAKMSQKAVSESTGINQGDISKIECGLSNPSIQTLDRLAHAMGYELKIDFVPL